MKKYFLSAFSIVTLSFIVLLSCNKINLPTELGRDLIPPVDNINTFDTTIEVETYSGVFDPVLDTFKMPPVPINILHILGVVDNDPIFGKTNGEVFFQVAPGGFPFNNKPGSLRLDSVVLVIDHPFTYGDTLAPQTIQVSEIEQSNDFVYGTGYKLDKQFTTSSILGSKTFTPVSTKDSIRVINYPDTNNVANQIRIKLDDSFGERLLAYDSIGANDGYSTDSIFRTKFKGFALRSIAGGNALMSINLTSQQTRLAVYYRYDNATTPTDEDTAVAEFPYYAPDIDGLGQLVYSVNAYKNANANYVSRDYNGTQVASGAGDETIDELLYIQNTPGTYANIKIPKLADLPNCVVHLAELQMESVHDVSDALFDAPPNVFLDVYDSSASKFKLVPYVFSPFLASGFGEPERYELRGYESFYSTNIPDKTFYEKADPLGNTVKQWRFNLTRYAQQIVSDKAPLHMMRLYAPALTFLPIGDLSAPESFRFRIPQSTFAGTSGIGRARIAGGNHPTQKMKLRVVYSKLK